MALSNNNSAGNYVRFTIGATGFTLTATPGTVDRPIQAGARQRHSGHSKIGPNRVIVYRAAVDADPIHGSAL
jgi:hypothetical protein